MKRLLLFAIAVSSWAACTPDNRGICITGLTAAQDSLLGPLIPFGASPWTFGDATEKGVADNLAPVSIAEGPVLGTPCSGTVSFPGSGQVLTTTTDMTTCLAGQVYVVVNWTSIDGAGTGRLLCPIQSVASTTITCSENMHEPAFSGSTAYVMPGADAHGFNFTYWIAEQPSNGWNYYDLGIALYRLFYRTGTTAYQTYARQIADINWQWNIDHGYRTVYPRAASMISQFFRALDGHSERFPYLYNWISLMVPSWADPSACPNCDNRESGYVLWDIALGAKTDPDATRHSQYCSWLSTYTTTWNSVQAADGSFSENEFAINPSYPMAPKSYSGSLIFGGAPWREAINVKSLEAAYEALKDTSSQGCNNVSLAASTLTTITNAVAWQNLYGLSSVNRGSYYEVNSPSNDQIGNSLYPGAGTVSATRTSTAITGSGTNWLTAGYCGGTYYIGIVTPYPSPRGVYKIASCADNTHATLNVAFGLFGETADPSGAVWVPAPSASTSCGTSLAAYCYTGAASADRNLNRTMCGGTAWLYGQTLNPTYKVWADECLSSVFGGPTAGLTTAVNLGIFVTPCSGPGCDGYITDTVVSAPSCIDTSGVPPCAYGGGVYQSYGMAKNFDEAFGAPGIDNALAWRLYGSTTGNPLSSRSIISGKTVH